MLQVGEEREGLGEVMRAIRSMQPSAVALERDLESGHPVAHMRLHVVESARHLGPGGGEHAGNVAERSAVPR